MLRSAKANYEKSAQRTIMQLSHSKVRYRYKPATMLILLAALAKGTTLWVAWARSDHLAVAFRLTQARHIKRACGQQQTNKQTTTKRPAATSAACADTFVCNLLIHCAFKARQKRTRTHQRLEGRWLNGRHYYSPVPQALPSVAALREHSNAETACVFACVCLCFLM